MLALVKKVPNGTALLCNPKKLTDPKNNKFVSMEIDPRTGTRNVRPFLVQGLTPFSPSLDLSFCSVGRALLWRIYVTDGWTGPMRALSLSSIWCG